ncbi:MAG: ATP-binding protein [Hyphomicrobium sp.]
MQRVFSQASKFNTRLELALLLIASILCVLVLTSAVIKFPLNSPKLTEGIFLVIGISTIIVFVALGLTFLGIRTYQKAKNFQNSEIENLKRHLVSYTAIVKAEPQILIHWDEKKGFKIIESSLSHISGIPHADREILRYGAWLEKKSAVLLKTGIDSLFAEGKTFNLILTTTRGSHIEVEGRATGSQAILRFRDIAGYKRELSLILDQQKKISRDVLSSRTLLNILPSPAWLRDKFGKLTWINKAYVKAVDAVGEKEVIETQIELVESRHRRSIEQALKKNGTYDGKVELMVGNVPRVHQIIIVTLAEESAGVAIDLAELEGTKNTLDRHISAYDRALERVSTAIAIFNAKAELTFCNTGYRKLWQLDEKWLDANPQDGAILDRLRDECKLPDVPNYKEWKAKLHAIYKDGGILEDLWHLANGRILQVIAEGRPDGGMTYFFNDKTEKLSLESRYIELNKVQGETLNSLKEGVAVFGTDGRLKLFNNAFSHIWHLSSRQLSLSPHIEEFIKYTRVLVDDGNTWENIKYIVTGFPKDRSPLEGQMLRPDESVIDFNVKPLPDGGTLLIFSDVTDTRKYQRTLQERNDALIVADRLKNQFIGHVSYELRTPLTNIIGFSDLLLSPQFGPLLEKQKEYLDHINLSSKSLLSIINDLLDLATIDAGSLELQLSTVDPHSVIDSTLKGLQERAARKGLTIDVSIQSYVHPFTADEARIKQILYNLILNAISFSKNQGVINISCWQDNEDIVFCVEDRGIGIPLEEQKIVFQRFETRNQAGEHRGTGLGLSLAKSLTEMHRGTIELESKPGIGTKVTIRLPMHQKSKLESTISHQFTKYHENSLENRKC